MPGREPDEPDGAGDTGVLGAAETKEVTGSGHGSDRLGTTRSRDELLVVYTGIPIP